MNIFYSLYFFGSTLNYICVYIEITSLIEIIMVEPMNIIYEEKDKI